MKPDPVASEATRVTPNGSDAAVMVALRATAAALVSSTVSSATPPSLLPPGQNQVTAGPVESISETPVAAERAYRCRSRRSAAAPTANSPAITVRARNRIRRITHHCPASGASAIQRP